MSADRKATSGDTSVSRQKGNIGRQYCQQTERQDWKTMLLADRKTIIGDSALST